MMTEKEILDLLSDYLDDRLDRPTRQAVEAGLARSAAARQTLRELADTVHRLETLPRLSAPVGLRASIRSAAKRQMILTRAGREMVSSESRRVLWRRALPLAAAVAISCSGALLVWWVQLRFADDQRQHTTDPLAIGTVGEMEVRHATPAERAGRDADRNFSGELVATEGSSTPGSSTPGSSTAHSSTEGSSTAHSSTPGSTGDDRRSAGFADPNRMVRLGGGSGGAATTAPTDPGSTGAAVRDAKADSGSNSGSNMGDQRKEIEAGREQSVKSSAQPRPAPVVTAAAAGNKYAAAAAPPSGPAAAKPPSPRGRSRAPNDHPGNGDPMADANSLREQVLHMLPSVAEIARSVPPSPMPVPPSPTDGLKADSSGLPDSERLAKAAKTGSAVSGAFDLLDALIPLEVRAALEAESGTDAQIRLAAATETSAGLAIPTELVLVSAGDVGQLEARLRRELQPLADRGTLVWLQTADPAAEQAAAEQKDQQAPANDPPVGAAPGRPPSRAPQPAGRAAAVPMSASFTLTTHDPAVVAEVFAALRRAAAANSVLAVEWAPSLEACQQLANAEGGDRSDATMPPNGQERQPRTEFALDKSPGKTGDSKLRDGPGLGGSAAGAVKFDDEPKANGSAPTKPDAPAEAVVLSPDGKVLSVKNSAVAPGNAPPGRPTPGAVPSPAAPRPAGGFADGDSHDPARSLKPRQEAPRAASSTWTALLEAVRLDAKAAAAPPAKQPAVSPEVAEVLSQASAVELQLQRLHTAVPVLAEARSKAAAAGEGAKPKAEKPKQLQADQQGSADEAASARRVVRIMVSLQPQRP